MQVSANFNLYQANEPDEYLTGFVIVTRTELNIYELSGLRMWTTRLAKLNETSLELK